MPDTPHAGLTNTKNVWEYAAIKVHNKGVLARIGHSSRFHSMRSAINSKGSFGSKALQALGAAGRASLSLIPIPVIGSLLSQAEQAIESKLRSYVHTRKLKPGITKGEEVKFKLKEVSVADMDRYRFKVEHSYQELRTAMDAWNSGGKQAAVDGPARCAKQAELAYAVAQAERRLEIFETKVTELKTLMLACETWATSVRSNVVTLKNTASAQFADIVRLETTQHSAFMVGSVTANAATQQVISTYHGGCDEFCVHKDNKVHTSWDKFRMGSAELINELQSPFSAESFLSLNRASFESAKQTDNYLEKSQRSS